MPPVIKQIAEVALVVSDLERSHRFYHEVLGLQEFQYPALRPGAGATFHLANGYLGLWLPGEWKKINPHIPGPDGCPRCHGPGGFTWVPGRDRGGAPWVLHHAPNRHEIVSATVPGHSCPPECQKVPEIEAFLELWIAKNS